MIDRLCGLYQPLHYAQCYDGGVFFFTFLVCGIVAIALVCMAAKPTEDK